MPDRILPVDAFGDHFLLEELPLPRAASGYAVQLLDTDQVLDRETGRFLSVRAANLKALFDCFEDAHQAACHWAMAHCTPPMMHKLAIVPAGFDLVLHRHILIYGVLCGQP